MMEKRQQDHGTYMLEDDDPHAQECTTDQTKADEYRMHFSHMVSSGCDHVA